MYVHGYPDPVMPEESVTIDAQLPNTTEAPSDRVEWRGTHNMPWLEFSALRERVAVGGLAALSTEEHRAIIARTARGDRRAGELLLMLNGGLAWIKANEIKRNKASFADIDIDEVMQEMRIATLQAAHRYDPSKGAFSTYLVWWFRAYTHNHNSGDPIIHVNQRCFASVEARKSLDEQALVVARNVVSTDTPIAEDSGNTIGNTIPSADVDPETAYGHAESATLNKYMVTEALDVLNDREHHVITARYLA